MKAKLEFVTNQSFGRLTIVDEVEPRVYPSGRRKRRGIFRCECGVVKEMDLVLVVNGTTLSCGCINRQRLDEANQKRKENARGAANDPSHPEHLIYKSWTGMRARCHSPSFKVQPSYANVKCDPRWETFQGFLDHPPAGSYEPGLVLARTGDVGDYSPENCRWATRSENTREMVERRMLKLPDGRFANDVAKSNGITSSRWTSRVRAGWPLLLAVTRPPGQQFNRYRH